MKNADIRSTVRQPDRRGFLAASLSAGLAAMVGKSAEDADKRPGPALIAITLDLEMSRNFPTWGDTHWDYEKGNLNEATKRYTTAACQRVKAAGGRVHCFAVGRVFEQADVSWLKEIAAEGHPIGNHTYDHVNVLATRVEDLQFRFRRAPWLIEGKTSAEVIRENIRLTSAAIRARLGMEPVGFRTPGGFPKGLLDRPDVQRLIADQGFAWVSSKYPVHALGDSGKEPSEAILNSIVQAQSEAQPFVYPNGLVEIPMSPISDISAFRSGRWKLEWFLEAVRRAVTCAIESRRTFDFLGHPSCLYVVDPEFRVIDLICELVRRAGEKAQLAHLGTIAERVRNA